MGNTIKKARCRCAPTGLLPFSPLWKQASSGPERQKPDTPFGVSGFFYGSGGWIRTNDLWVMSPTSYHCSTPQCSGCKFNIVFAGCKIYFAKIIITIFFWFIGKTYAVESGSFCHDCFKQQKKNILPVPAKKFVQRILGLKLFNIVLSDGKERCFCNN